MSKGGGKYYYMTEGLSQLYKEAPDQDKALIAEALDHYIDEYKRIRKLSNGVSAAFNFHGLIETMLEDLKDDSITCKKGCHFCCMIHVDITQDEADLLTEYCEEKGIKLDPKRLERQAGHDRDTWGNQPYRDWGCTFLDRKTGTCKVYEHRPSACRNYLVVSDPKDCDTRTTKNTLRASYLRPNIIVSAAMNCCESDSMAKLLLKSLNGNLAKE